MARLDYLSRDAWADDLVWDPVASKVYVPSSKLARSLVLIG